VSDNAAFRISHELSWDSLIGRNDLFSFLQSQIKGASAVQHFNLASEKLLPPVGSQEVWAAGVTYYRSRDARMEESKDAGGGTFYDRVYAAERPELFFKSSGSRVVGQGQPVRIRRDSKWNVPEPELTLVISAGGKIIGYTIGNDMSSRDIEGENPLYLPQAKVYDGACAIGPGIFVSNEPLSKATQIKIAISRNGATAFEGTTTLAELKRRPEELIEFLYRESSHSVGCFLMTGTGIVPTSAFTLEPGDRVSITIDSIGTLENIVAPR
jgi:2-dehydro-3-deoxy-D-arabinonate dehydratase